MLVHTVAEYCVLLTSQLNADMVYSVACTSPLCLLYWLVSHRKL